MQKADALPVRQFQELLLGIDALVSPGSLAMIHVHVPAGPLGLAVGSAAEDAQLREAKAGQSAVKSSDLGQVTRGAPTAEDQWTKTMLGSWLGKLLFCVIAEELRSAALDWENVLFVRVYVGGALASIAAERSWSQVLQNLACGSNVIIVPVIGTVRHPASNHSASESCCSLLAEACAFSLPP